MNGLSKMQKVLLCAGVVLIVAALFGAPKYWDYCEMQALKAEFERFVDVENWPDSAYVKLSGYEIAEADLARVKSVVAELEFDGEFDEQHWFDLHFIGTGMVGSGGSFFLLHREGNAEFPGYYVEVAKDGSYVYETRYRFAASNGQELVMLLQELKVKYPG